MLAMLGVQDFKIIPAQGDENLVQGTPAHKAVLTLSRNKAQEVSKQCGEDEVIIAADTLVELGGEILGKPENKEAAAVMLKKLSGNEHTVFTGVTVMRGKDIISEYESTKVRFREMTDREIDAYIATGEPMDKAGAYGAQGIGALFVERIDGDFFNVMGLPLCRLGKMLEKLGVNLI